MTNISVNRTLKEQLKENIELRSKCENMASTTLIVSKEVYDKAERIAKELNTDVEEIFVIAVCRLVGSKALS